MEQFLNKAFWNFVKNYWNSYKSDTIFNKKIKNQVYTKLWYLLLSILFKHKTLKKIQLVNLKIFENIMISAKKLEV